MTPEQARAIFAAGEQAVIERLCGLDARVQTAEQQIDALQRTLAQREKNSSTSSKRPSSDDLTKPHKGSKNNAEEKDKHKGKGNRIGGQPGHPKHSRPAYPPETLSRVH